MKGTFSWSPPRGGVLNSSSSANSARETISKRELKSLGIGQGQNEAGPSTRTSRAKSREIAEKQAREVSGQYTPPGSRKPSTLDPDHFVKKGEKLDLARKLASEGSISTPGSLSPVTPSSITGTPETLDDEDEKVFREEEAVKEEREVEESIAGGSSPRESLSSFAGDRTLHAGEAKEEEVEDEGLGLRIPATSPPPELENPQPQAPTMAAEAPLWQQLPPIGHPSAPVFTGEPSQLHPFLRTFEALGDYGWSDAKMVSTCVKYVQTAQERGVFALTEKKWKSAEAAKQTWAEFKSMILNRYPTAFDDTKGYTLDKLERHIANTPRSAFQSAAEFQKFMNYFEVIAEDLTEKHLMTEKGLNGKLCDAIPLSEVKRTTLCQQDFLGKEPSDVPWRDFGDQYRKMLSTGVTGGSAASEEVRVEVKTETRVKTEPSDSATMLATLTALQNDLRMLREEQRAQPSYGNRGGYTPQPYNQRSNTYGSRPADGGFRGRCAYCDEIGHMMMSCGIYRHDQAANGVFFHFTQQRLKVDGRDVPMAPGASPRDAAAEFLGQRYVPSAPADYPARDAPQTSTNMMNVVRATGPPTTHTGIAIAEPRIQEWITEDGQEGAPEEEEVEDEDEDADDDEDEMDLVEVYAAMAQMAEKMKKEKGKRMVMDGVEIPKMKWKNAKTGPPKKDEKGKRTDKGEAALRELAERIAAKGKGTGGEKKEPAYHLQAATDDPEAQARVLASCKDGCVPMTFGDLLAVSDPLRAKVHAETRKKRVPNNAQQEDEGEEVKMSSVREAAVNELWEMALKMPLTPALSKLMAASDFVRSNMHADTNRRAQAMPDGVAQTQTMAMITGGPIINPLSPRIAIAAKETQLWGISVFVSDYDESHEFQLNDVVVDDGSGICAIRSDVAARLAFPYEHAPILCQQFDGTCVEHSDLIRNLPITVGSVRVYVQAYVLPHIGPEMILGGPFEAVVRMGKVTLADARPVYKVHDPSRADVCIELVGNPRKVAKQGF